MTTLKLALRTLLKSPFVTGVAVLSIALGIGANSAIYAILDQILLRSLPVVEDPDGLVNLGAPGPKPGSTSCNETGGCEDVFSYLMFRDLERDGAGFAAVAAHRLFGANVAFDGRTDSQQGVLVSGRYFEALGLQPALGRLIAPEDDEQIGGHYVVVLSHGFWQDELGADPGVLNRTMVVNGQPLTVVGVAPLGFHGTTRGNDPGFFVPVAMTAALLPGWDRFDNRRAYYFYLFARLRPGGTVEQATETANALYTSIINEVEVPLQTSMTDQDMERFRTKPLVVEPGRRGQSSMIEESPTPLALLFTITLFVLLIACANVGNLLLARGAGRAQEMSIRSSLGGSRGQLLRQLLAESLVLALLGGLASLFVARWTLAIIISLMPPDAPAVIHPAIDMPMMLFTAALAMGTGFVFGLYPALHATRSDLIAVLRVSGAQPSDSRAAQRYRNVLVTAQFALSMALLFGAGLFVRSLVNVSRADLGLRADNLVAFDVAPSLNGYEPERTLELFQRAEEELRALPGVTGVTAALVPVLAGNNWNLGVAVEGFAWEPGLDASTRFNAVGPGYFATMGIPLLAGREFTDSDLPGAPEVAIVNEAFAHKFGLNGAEALGKYLSNDGAAADELDIQIVGLVQDTKYSEVMAENPPILYMPYKQESGLGSATFYVRAALDPGEIIRAIPGVVGRLDANLPVNDLMTLDQQVRETIFVERMVTMLAAGFGVLATLLAAVGLYGVLSFSVARRTREIGVRMALGAEGRGVRGMVLRQVLWLALIGVGLGLAGAYWLARGAQSMLYEVEGYDPVVLVSASVLLLGVALSAGYLPARRASRVDPMVALRSD